MRHDDEIEMSPPPDEPTVQELASFEAETVGFIAARFRWGIPTGITVALALCPAAWYGYPDARAGAVLPPLAAAVGMTLGGLATLIRPIARRPVVLVFIVIFWVALCAGVAAAHTGAYASPYVLIMLLIWLFLAAFLPLSPSQLWIIALPVPFVFAAVLDAYGIDPMPPPLLAVILAGCHLYSHFGVVIRRRAALTSYVAQSRLAEARQKLATLNRELEARVESQVQQTVERAREVETLNAQLRVEVRERSRELAQTLQRLNEERGFEELSTGAVVGGRVRLSEQLGRGGMGTVHAGTDLATGERVAVKLLGGNATSPALVRRFLAEAEAAASVDHPVIVKTLAVDVDEAGRPYQIMELVEGISLRHLRAWRGKLAPDEVAAIGTQLAGALACAHAAGVVHRDIKPRNVLLQADEPRVRLVDFGIAKQRGGLLEDGELTMTGQLLGTPAYMAPEQIAPGGEVTAATDVYGLGILLYELLTDELPYTASGQALLLAHVRTEPRPLGALAPVVPAPMVEVLMSCLAKEPTDRPSADGLALALSAYAGERLPSLPPSRLTDSSPPPPAGADVTTHGGG